MARLGASASVKSAIYQLGFLSNLASSMDEASAVIYRLFHSAAARIAFLSVLYLRASA